MRLKMEWIPFWTSILLITRLFPEYSRGLAKQDLWGLGAESYYCSKLTFCQSDPPKGESFWQKESFLQYTTTLLKGTKDPVLPTQIFIQLLNKIISWGPSINVVRTSESLNRWKIHQKANCELRKKIRTYTCVRCACKKGFWNMRAICMGADLFWVCEVRSQFRTFLGKKGRNFLILILFFMVMVML